MKTINLSINYQEDREPLILALAKNGYKVYTQTIKEGPATYTHEIIFECDDDEVKSV